MSVQQVREPAGCVRLNVLAVVLDPGSDPLKVLKGERDQSAVQHMNDVPGEPTPTFFVVEGVCPRVAHIGDASSLQGDES